MGAPLFLVKLMDRPKLGKGIKLGPEDVICIDFANNLRAWTLDGRLNAIWCHVPNEVGGGNGKFSAIRYAVAKALGLISGFPDYVFAWSGGVGFIEAKAGRNCLNDNQKLFQQWCEYVGLPYEVIRSPEEGREVLRAWGLLA